MSAFVAHDEARFAPLRFEYAFRRTTWTIRRSGALCATVPHPVEMYRSILLAASLDVWTTLMTAPRLESRGDLFEMDLANFADRQPRTARGRGSRGSRVDIVGWVDVGLTARAKRSLRVARRPYRRQAGASGSESSWVVPTDAQLTACTAIALSGDLERHRGARPACRTGRTVAHQRVHARLQAFGLARPGIRRARR